MSDIENNITTIPLRGIKGMIAKNMCRSLSESAQLTHHAECDITTLLERKKSLKDQETNISVEDFLIFFTTKVLRQNPALNGRLENQEISLMSAVHMSVAIALPDDLLVAPTIFDTDKKSLTEIVDDRKDLVDRSGKNKLSVKEMTEGTFTISNLGLTRVRYFTPILNLPQLAILGVGGTTKRAMVMNDDKIQARSMLGLSLTFDHRAVNGATAAKFLSDLCQNIESADVDPTSR